MGIAVESRGRRVGIYDVSGGRVNQEHHRMVELKKATVAFLAFLQAASAHRRSVMSVKTVLQNLLPAAILVKRALQDNKNLFSVFAR